MSNTAELFEIDNVRRFRKFWDTCSQHEQAEISKIVKQEMGEEVEVTVSGKELNKQAKEILQFLNAKTGKKFREVDVNLKMIKCRLKTGATVQECKAIIAMKVREWLGGEMEYCLRPSTIFNATKFEMYIGELGG